LLSHAEPNSGRRSNLPESTHFGRMQAMRVRNDCSHSVQAFFDQMKAFCLEMPRQRAFATSFHAQPHPPFFSVCTRHPRLGSGPSPISLAVLRRPQARKHHAPRELLEVFRRSTRMPARESPGISGNTTVSVARQVEHSSHPPESAISESRPRAASSRTLTEALTIHSLAKLSQVLRDYASSSSTCSMAFPSISISRRAKELQHTVLNGRFLQRPGVFSSS